MTTQMSDPNVTPLIVSGLYCGWCDRRVVIYSEGSVTAPPAGWVVVGHDEWVCPDHIGHDDDAGWNASDAEYFAVVETQR